MKRGSNKPSQRQATLRLVQMRSTRFKTTSQEKMAGKRHYIQEVKLKLTGTLNSIEDSKEMMVANSETQVFRCWMT